MNSPSPARKSTSISQRFFLDESGQNPAAGHFIFYGSPHSPDESIECFDDIKGQEHEKILGTP
jgi:hypothetical protein